MSNRKDHLNVHLPLLFQKPEIGGEVQIKTPTDVLLSVLGSSVMSLEAFLVSLFCKRLLDISIHLYPHHIIVIK